MKKTAKKLDLNRQTVRDLASDDLEVARGAKKMPWTCGATNCNSCPPVLSYR